MLLDYRTYLPDDLLMKIDRATMLNALESRAPYLDRALTEFAFALPLRCKVRGLTTKWLLKRVALRYLPRSIVTRRKRGLSVPIASWIDGGLRSEVDRLLDGDRLARQGIVEPQRVARLLAEHRSRRANHARPLWTLIVLQYWLERWAPERAAA
jgi:asparagine synthase (glutamine-hydrolysing)